jgi:hypothetical protein
MSLIRAIRCASAPLDHRLTVGDGPTILRVAKTRLCSPQPPLGAHSRSCPFGAIPVAQRIAELIRLASITDTTNGLDSNPHSTRPPPVCCHTARGFLPRGLSDAYRAGGDRLAPSAAQPACRPPSPPRGGRHLITLNSSCRTLKQGVSDAARRSSSRRRRPRKFGETSGGKSGTEILPRGRSNSVSYWVTTGRSKRAVTPDPSQIIWVDTG